MPHPTPGIHHITAIASNPQRNLDFYTQVLGMRLIKQTVNFDDPGTHHLYYADSVGSPGSVLTFFPWPNAKRGHHGTGEVLATGLAILPSALNWWIDRLNHFDIDHTPVTSRFSEQFIAFDDPDGMHLELVASEHNQSLAHDHNSQIPDHATIRGFHSATLLLEDTTATVRLLTDAMGLQVANRMGNRVRYQAAGLPHEPGQFIDLVSDPNAHPAHMGAGSVHHIAFRVQNEDEQEPWRTHLRGHGIATTPIQNRQYFRSIYCREPGGVIVEFATDGPGFMVDETMDALGSALRLPPWLEARRSEIVQKLPRITTPLLGPASP